MTVIKRAGPLLLTTFLFWGCASTNVDRARDVSSAGVRYTQATSQVVDVAIDAIIDADSEAEVRRKPRPANMPTPEQRTKELDELDTQLVDNVVYYAKLRSSIGTLEAYFQALQALANGSQADATQAAVGTLADRVNSLNVALEAGRPGVKPVLTDEQKSALTGLSKDVAKQVHGAVVGRALERDAPVIGKAILLQQQVLSVAESDISDKIMDANERFYVDKVLAPYQTATIDSTWVDDRRIYIKVKALGETLDTVKSAQVASKQMEAVWRKILSGDYSAAELATMLRETDELLGAVAALKAAEKPKATP
jgi:hypothetical protein